MKKHSKRYTGALQSVDLSKEYSLADAVGVLARLPKANFDETVELSFRLGVDPKQSDQMVRGTVTLPHGTGRKVRVLAFTDKPEEAIKAGADIAGLKDVIERIQGGWMEFDVAVATTEAMKEVRTIARLLGPKGLMPNPKAGTVSDNLTQAIREVKAGRVEFKMDKAGNVGVGIGKRSFSNEQIAENAQAVIQTLVRLKPSSVKDKFIRTAVLSSTMSPGIKINTSEYAKS